MTTLSPFFRARRNERSSSYTVTRHFSCMYVILSLAPPYNTYRKILITSDNHLTLNFHAANLQKASRNMEEHFNYVFFCFVKITPQHLSIIPPSTSLTKNWNSNFQSCMVMHVFFDSSSKHLANWLGPQSKPQNNIGSSQMAKKCPVWGVPLEITAPIDH